MKGISDGSKTDVARASLFARLVRAVDGPLLVYVAVYWPMYLAIVYCVACLLGVSMDRYIPDNLRQADLYLKNTLIFFGVKRYAAERIFAYHASFLIFPVGWLFVCVAAFVSRGRLREEYNKKTHSFFEGKVFACFCVGTCCVIYLAFGLEISSRSRLSFLLFSDSFVSFAWYVSFLFICYSVVAQFILSIYGWKVTSWKTKVHHG
jgi:hypothetical protein